ncbi:MAG: hypothetical protein IPK59_19180 [Rhodospirillaceae bacterium]|nr:hypothetical protein [Rhodospirillaceae bacterium]
MIPPRKTDLQPLPLAIAACRRTWTERDDLLRLAVMPLALSFALNLWVWHAYGDVFSAIARGEMPAPELADAMLIPTLFVGLVSWFATSVFAVNWMRVLLLGPGAVAGLGLAIDRRQVKFTILAFLTQLVLGVGIMLGLLVAAFLLPSFALMAILGFVMLLLYVMVLLRLAPLWVGIAIDAPLSFKQAWQRTSGYGMQLLSAAVLIFLAILFGQTVLQIFLGVLGLVQAAPMAMLFISLVIQFILTACICAVFVLAYPRFVSETV